MCSSDLPSNSIRLFGLSGSLRKESHSTSILRTLAEAIAAQADLQMGNVGSLPLYNQDDDTENAPAPVAAMRKAVAESQGLVIVTPEYNYGVPGVVKNAIDWLSRPAYKSCLIGKPFLIISSSPAFTGGVRAQAQIRESLMAALARPVIAGEVVLASVHTKIADGKLIDKASIDFAVKALTQLINDAQAAPAAKAA